MTSRSWQLPVAIVSIGAMVVVLYMFGLRRDDDAAPTKAVDSQPHAGTKHFTAAPHEGDAAAPLQVFAHSAAGDWHAYEQFTEDGAPRKTLTALVRVDAVDDKQVTLTKTERESSLSPPAKRSEQRPRAGLTIDQLAGNAAKEWTLYGLTIADEAHEVGGRSFKCKKVRFSLQDPLDKSKQATVEMWISDEVPGGGFVELEQSFANMPFSVKQTLVGFGTATATTWGTKPD
jgi:hypothetical protein